MSNTNASLQAAGAWFVKSGIQEPSGGVARYYRSDLAKNARVSTEITGYTISALLFLNDRTGQTEYLDAAMLAARFLMNHAWDPRLAIFPFEYSSNGDHGPAYAYFFDSGIIVRGLLGVWRVSNESEFLDLAIAGGRSMLADFRRRDALHPILALPGKTPLPYEPRWSATPGCYQLKAALAWYELFEATGDNVFLRAYEAAVQAALASEPDFLPGDPNPERVMDRLHPYLYFLEGLLPLIDRTDCASIFRKGLQRVSEHLDQIETLFVRSDVYAQLLRVRLYGEHLGGIPLDFYAAAHEASQLSGFQVTSSDPRQSGGFLFGHKRGQPMPFVNPVSTAFGVQALALWEDRTNSVLEVRRHTLI